jgi:ATP-dependent Clp protease ATP-binding subunit ClpA
MFERFTKDARQIVVRARQEADELRHPLVGTEHLLLAMLAGSGTATDVLRDAGVELPAARAELARLVESTPPLMDEEDAEALRSVGIDVDAVLARILESFGPDALVPPAQARRGWFGRHRRAGGRFAPRSKKVLELSLREAIRLKQNEIGSGHILLGLLREGNGLGAKILAEAGVDFAQLRDRTEERLLRRAA